MGEECSASAATFGLLLTVLTLILCVYFYTREREKYFMLLLPVAAVQALVGILHLLVSRGLSTGYLEPLFTLLSLIVTVFLIFGANAFLKRPAPKWMTLVIFAILPWIVIAYIFGVPERYTYGVPAIIFLSVCALTGKAIISSRPMKGAGEALSGAGFVLFGINAFFSLLHLLPLLGVSLDSFFILLIFFGFVLSFLESGKRASTARFDQLLGIIDAIPEPIFVKDGSGEYIGCNPYFCDFLGKQKEEIIGKTVFELSPREIADTYHKKDNELFVAPGIQHYRYSVVDRDGIERQVAFHKATFPKGSQEPEGIVGIVHDVTEFEKTKGERQNTEAKYLSLFENMFDGFVYCRAVYNEKEMIDFIVVEVNRAFEEIAGMDRSLLVGKLGGYLLPEIHHKREDLLKRLEQVADTLQPDKFEFHHAGSGQWFVVSAHTTVPGFFALIISEIPTEREAKPKLDRAMAVQGDTLRECEEELRMLFDTSVHAVIRTDMETGVIINCNAAASQFFGRSSESLIGTLVESLFPSDKCYEYAQIPQSTPEDVQEVEGEIVTAENARYPVAITKTMLTTGTRSIIQWEYRDLRKQKAVEQEQKKFVALIENSQDFIGMADLDGRVIYLNHAGCKLVGIGKKMAVGRHIGDFTGDESMIISEVMPAIRERGKWTGQGFLRHFRSDRMIPVFVNVFVVRDTATTAPLCIGTIMKDLTHLVRDEQQ